MKPSEEAKKETLKRVKAYNACQSGYAEAFKATNKIELLNAITANLRWCLATTRMIDATFIEENFTAGTYARGTTEAGVMNPFPYDSSAVKPYGSSTTKVYDNSTIDQCCRKRINKVRALQGAPPLCMVETGRT